MIDRRSFLKATGSAALVSASAKLVQTGASDPTAQPTPAPTPSLPYRPVITPNGKSLPWVMKDGVKEFHLIAEPVDREFAPGMVVKCWGYNGLSPGPTLEAVEGDRVRIKVTNRLPEGTSVHWHGILLPNGMDGVSGLTQSKILPGETWVYEFKLKQHGTFMYHPHADEMVQMAVGMMGFFIVHPKKARPDAPTRDYAIMVHEWAIHPGTSRPDPAVMTEFNIFTFNSRIYPGTDPLIVKTGDRVRVRLGNLSMDEHPVHLHGFNFKVTGTDGGVVPETARWPETTVLIPVGSTRDIEFIADEPGDWAFHCHKSHHTMNAMGHDVPNLLGVNQDGVADAIKELVPDYFAMGETGMSEHSEHLPYLKGPHNTLPMMMGTGPFGPIEMGGMFTLVKVRDRLESYDKDPGWYEHPPNTLAYRLKE